MKIAQLKSCHKEMMLMQAEYEVSDSQIEGFLKFGGLNILKFDITKNTGKFLPTTGFVNFAEQTRDTMKAFIGEIASIEIGSEFGYDSNLLNTYYIQTSLDI